MASSLVLSRKKEGISSTHLQSALVQASLLLKHQPTGQLKRTRPLTSYPVSQSRVLPTESRSWSRVFTDQEGRKCVLQNSRLLWLQSLPCRPGFVVGSGVLWTVKLLVKYHTKNANTDVISSQPIACPSDQPRSRSRVFTDQEGRKCVLQNSRLL